MLYGGREESRSKSKMRAGSGLVNITIIWVSTKSSISQLECIFIFYTFIRLELHPTTGLELRGKRQALISLSPFIDVESSDARSRSSAGIVGCSDARTRSSAGTETCVVMYRWVPCLHRSRTRDTTHSAAGDHQARAKSASLHIICVYTSHVGDVFWYFRGRQVYTTPWTTDSRSIGNG